MGQNLTDNFDVDVSGVLSCRVAYDDGVDALVLALRPLQGEHTVALGALHVNTALSI